MSVKTYKNPTYVAEGGKTAGVTLHDFGGHHWFRCSKIMKIPSLDKEFLLQHHDHGIVYSMIIFESVGVK